LSRTERSRPRKWLDELLVEILRSAVSAWSLSLLLRLFSLQEVVLPTLGALVLASGIAYAMSLCLQRPRADRSAYRPLREAQAALARVWIGVGAILVVLGTLSKPPVVLPLVGAIACWALYRRAGVLAARRDRHLRASKRPVRVGALATAVLTIPILLVSYTGFAYAGMEAVELYKHSLPPSDEGGGGSDEDDESDSSTGLDEEDEEPSYAKLCPELPDPQDIGYGLGELFEHDGAVDAGCGDEAERVAVSTWVSIGSCGTEFRSLAIVGEAREPVLVYGAPARFARAEADEGKLRFAEAAKVAGGEIVIVGTASGTFVFARSSPALEPGGGDAVRCGEIDEVARPYTKLPPPLAELWLEHMAAEQEWSWPQLSEESDDVVFAASDRLPTYGSCEAASRCRLDGSGIHRVEEGRATVTVDELEAYAPPGIGE
jgi:hypothetical protein